MPEKIVRDPAKDRSRNPKAKEKPVKADEPLHAEEAKEEKPARSDKINKYGFLHVGKELAEHLGLVFTKGKGKDVPVTVEPIERGFIVKLKV